MENLTRRELLKDALKVALALGVSQALTPRLADALESLAAGNPPVLWLQAQSCSGCSVALLNSTAPGPAELLTRYLSLVYHPTLSTATGQTVSEVLNKTIAKGGYLLAVEGTIPVAMPRACTMGEGHKPMGDWVKEAASRALAAVAVGTCACHGGIPAAEGNPTGAAPLGAYLKAQGIGTPVLNIPGCPCHPDWLVGTLACVIMGLRQGKSLAASLPPLDELGRPKAFFGRLVHDQCPRFADYERERFAKNFSDPGCLFKLGCVGARTPGDCTLRLWNGGANTCINAGGPCIGCTRPEFTARRDFPLYPMNQAKEDKQGAA